VTLPYGRHFSRVSLLHLAENDYENLVEVLTNDTISTADVSPSNPALSLPSSSFLVTSDQSDIYKTEKEKMFHNNKGDLLIDIITTCHD
jgi:hypothetical protein